MCTALCQQRDTSGLTTQQKRPRARGREQQRVPSRGWAGAQPSPWSPGQVPQAIPAAPVRHSSGTALTSEMLHSPPSVATARLTPNTPDWAINCYFRQRTAFLSRFAANHLQPKSYFFGLINTIKHEILYVTIHLYTLHLLSPTSSSSQQHWSFFWKVCQTCLRHEPNKKISFFSLGRS